MNLLIVDDQTSVVNGIAQGIPWKMIGITEVFTAFNAFEAKEILSKHTIDIMLCDIEMPIENGLQLLQWVRQNNIDLECIFITAHAEFKYAKEAIRIGSYDYIVQPAPYEEVQKVVARAMLKVVEKNTHKQVYSYGKVMLEKKGELKGDIIKKIIQDAITQKRYEKYREVVSLPQWSQKCYCFLFQIFPNQENTQLIGDELMQFIVANVSGELFGIYEQDIIIHPIAESLYYILVYGEHGYFMDFEGFQRQVHSICVTLKNFYDLKIACYISDAVATSELSNSYHKLNAVKERNIACKEGVIQEDSLEDMQADKKDQDNKRYQDDMKYHLYSINRWKQYLSSNLTDTVKEEMKQYLYNLAEQDHLNQNVLYHFHIDLLRMVYDSLEEHKVRPHEVMEQIKNLNLYQASVQDLDSMVRFIDEIMNLFEENTAFEKEVNVVERIKEYIHDNIGKDFKRTDVAEVVHLNADYLTRVFKKSTGMTIGEYIIFEKMNVARNLIKTTALPIKYVASRVGYENFSHFSHSYKKVHGISPSEERK